jgi:hypothetical protein
MFKEPYLLAIGCLYCTTHYILFKTQMNSLFNNTAFTLRRFVGVVASDALSAAEAEPLFVRLVAIKDGAPSVRNPSALSHTPYSNVDASRRFDFQEMRVHRR